MKKILLFFLFSSVVILNACKKESEEEHDAAYYTASANCNTVVDSLNTFTLSVKAIMESNCAVTGCHNAITKADGTDFSDYATAKDEFLNAEALCTINHDCEAMPKGGAKLSDAVIAQLTCWVKNGCKE